ncbi:hypothetical protein RGQ29_012985 [Quercus rubra]|uniref:Uncharacterized protein n=1 Tax=Quercus rubra TaxID=3512 RepID=A0AAN7J4G7_QUERU|nr:hypothetical protein RGQ29_012985 [Quercus rubra]
MEYLACLNHTKIAQENWKGVKTAREGPIFSQLFFANDLILFAKATKRNFHTIKKVLNEFCSISGQKVNLEKFRIYFSPHTKPENITHIEHVLGIKHSKEFGKYLGIPILMDGRNKRAYDFIIDKICTRLSSWKARSLSLAGRLTLINSVTSAIPTHLMQCKLLPSKICTELDKINRNFL